MKGHRVSLQLPVTELGKADASFQIKKDGKLLGTMHISHGAFSYQPSGFMKKNAIKISWLEFDKMMKEAK
ncbi:hypothetical protein KTO58_21240 [Chitinophaga pendula]|uniref:hypothetical protein n=1 Tax=Chitinophaga TaxID=79328 RepID=UPI000BAF150D|nr:MULTISPECIES: hypothetical protein [Chitinophaga]ASZ10844.1 hypothetical protein CK934_07565 [Chitinophaga sp. MD30]UCJ06175.1 hypothetical protein KTO58_21240 [Chitinophaga pendula]